MTSCSVYRPRRGRSAARTTQTRNFTPRTFTAGTTHRWCSWIPSRTARRSSASTPRVTCACGRRSRYVYLHSRMVNLTDVVFCLTLTGWPRSKRVRLALAFGPVAAPADGHRACPRGSTGTDPPRGRARCFRYRRGPAEGRDAHARLLPHVLYQKRPAVRGGAQG